MMPKSTPIVPADRQPAWPEEGFRRRLEKCRRLLYEHGYITYAEMEKIDKRIDSGMVMGVRLKALPETEEADG
jgi:hypothetical protein